MLLDIVRQWNWVDILVIIISVRICYVAMKSGFTVELFKLLGIILAIYLSLHYYTTLADFAKERLKIKFIPLEFIDFLSFLILCTLGYLICAALREAIHHFVKMQPLPKLNRWGGLALGICRAFLFCGLLIFILVISTVAYFKKTVSSSYLGKRMFQIAPGTYSGLWDGIMSKFMTAEKFNATIQEVQENFNNP